MVDAPNFPANPTVAKIDTSKSTTKQVDEAPRAGNTFVDDLDAKKSRGYLDAPVALSSLPEKVLIRFTTAVSPYSAGEVAGVPKEFAVSVLRSGWADLVDAGQGPGIPVPRDTSGDSVSIANRPDGTSAAIVKASEIDDLKTENAAMRADLDKMGALLADLKKAADDSKTKKS